MPDFHVNMWVPSPLPARGVSFPGSLGSVTDGTILPTATRADNAAYTSDPMHNLHAKGVRLYIKNGTIGTTTLTVKIQTQNPVDATWIDLPGAVTAALTTDNDANTLTVYPGIAETGNVSVSDHLGPMWRVVATLSDGDTDTVSFSIGGDYLL